MFRRHINYFSHRSYCSASNWSNEIKNSKPFSEMPTLSLYNLVLNFLPSGKCYKKSMKEIQQLLYEEYGNVFKIPAMLRRSQFVITFNPDDFETVSIKVQNMVLIQLIRSRWNICSI